MSLFRYIFVIIGLILCGWVFVMYGTTRGYETYLTESEYRRMHPELIPTQSMIESISAGHTTSYASIAWLKLIQYIGENIGDKQYTTFLSPLTDHITDLHPYFTHPYELALLLTPIDGSGTAIHDQQTRAIQIGKKGITTLCNQTKMELIRQAPLDVTLWQKDALKNPCKNGMLPYYLAFMLQHSGIGNPDEVSEFYKLASMNQDAPLASRTLAVQSRGIKGDHLTSGRLFFHMGREAYDDTSRQCQQLADALLKKSEQSTPLDRSELDRMGEVYTLLPKTDANDTNEATLNITCRKMVEKGIREHYLAYITDAARGTDATTGDQLIALGKIPSLPVIGGSPNEITVIKRDGTWQYAPRAR